MTLKLVHGNFLQGLNDPSGLVLAPSCGVLARDGSLVMGAGAARDLATRLPGIARDLGCAIRASSTRRLDHWVYGLAVTRSGPHLAGAFQSKGHWAHPSSLELIALAASRLRNYLEQHPDLLAHLAFPGVGLGGLPVQQVSRILDQELQPVIHRVVLYLLPRGSGSARTGPRFDPLHSERG